jgi:hypothetical protein
MNALARFITFGARDADRRIAAFFAARPVAVADRYLVSSVVVRSCDRFTRLLWSSMLNSTTGGLVVAANKAWGRAGWRERYRTIGLVLIVAVGVHVAATVMQGPRPGWFWLIVPMLTFAFAVLLVTASRSPHSSK